MIERRGLLLGIAALVAVPSPAIVRASSLMRLSPVPSWKFITARWVLRIIIHDDGSLTLIDEENGGKIISKVPPDSMNAGENVEPWSIRQENGQYFTS